MTGTCALFHGKLKTTERPHDYKKKKIKAGASLRVSEGADFLYADLFSLYYRLIVALSLQIFFWGGREGGGGEWVYA